MSTIRPNRGLVDGETNIREEPSGSKRDTEPARLRSFRQAADETGDGVLDRDEFIQVCFGHDKKTSSKDTTTGSWHRY